MSYYCDLALMSAGQPPHARSCRSKSARFCCRSCATFYFSVVPIDPWKSSKDKKFKKSPMLMSRFARVAHSSATGSRESGTSTAAVPVLKDPKKITKMLQKLQKACPFDTFYDSRR
jgi:hypothetical protein